MDGDIGRSEEVGEVAHRQAERGQAPEGSVRRLEGGYTIIEVIIAVLMLFGLAFMVVAFIALLKYIGWI